MDKEQWPVVKIGPVDREELENIIKNAPMFIMPDTEIRRIEMCLIDRNIALAALENIKNAVWGHDIPHPGNCPEYRELHEKMQDIMKQIDEWKMTILEAEFYSR